MNVLIDSSFWIAYFRGEETADVIDQLIEEDLISMNELILAEIVPPLYIKKQIKLINLLKSLRLNNLEIKWDGIVEMQVTCLKKGINGIGISDLVIAQNAMQNNLKIFSLDKHFTLLSKYLPLAIYKI